jgi:hypothetical protein
MGVLAGWVIALSFPDLVIAGDPRVYLQRLQAIEDGGVPYVDPIFEHLPGMLVPFGLARLLSGFGGAFEFAVVFSLLMAGCLIATGQVLRRYHASTSRRWLLVIVPLLPFIVFRNDPWVTLLAVIGSSATGPGGWAAVLGVLSKGWPAVVAPLHWRAGARSSAVVIALTAFLAVALMATPGFADAQNAVGVHSESMAGSVLGLARIASGDRPGLVLTTALYVETDSRAALVGLVVGGVLAAAGAIAQLVSSDRAGALAGVGVSVVGVMLASPLLSTQYMLWVAPYVAIVGRRWLTSLGFGLSALSLAMILGFDAAEAGALWWWTLVVARNLGLIGLAVGLLAVSLDRTPDRQG